MQNRYFTQTNLRFPYDRISTSPDMKDSLVCSICYPDVYYKIQPFVISVCDQIDTDGGRIQSQEKFDELSDNIYTNLCSVHPDLVEYSGCHGRNSSVESLQMDFERFGDYDWDRDYDRDRRDRDRDHDRDRRRRDRDYYPDYRFRRRGLFRDFIDVLLLNELLRRGSLIYWYY